METQQLRLVFADDSFLVRDGVSGLLSESGSVDVVDTVADPQSLINVFDELDPDVVLTDIRMPPTFTNEGVVVAKRIRSGASEDWRGRVVPMSRRTTPSSCWLTAWPAWATC
jgi:DNA-binding NarL/FixJ family response regulator